VARLRRGSRAGASRVRMRMPSRRSEIAPTVERILAAVGEAGLSEEQRTDLAVAAAEALSNAAVHGNALRPAADVVVTVSVVPGKRADVRVRDSGPGFDYATLDDPTEPALLLAPRGRGVYLMRRLVDRVSFRRPGNSVCLTVLARG
jgi:serine/threonine-protein kinase RsbW